MGSRLAIRSGVVEGDELGEFQPWPDSRRMEDLIGSGEFESNLSRSGRVVVVGAFVEDVVAFVVVVVGFAVGVGFMIEWLPWEYYILNFNASGHVAVLSQNYYIWKIKITKKHN